MRNIIITDGLETVTLLPDLSFEIIPEDVGATAEMASGILVMDIIGTRYALKVPTGWLSAADLSKLRRMINKKHILTVTYPDIDGDKTDDFYVSQPRYRAFKYDADGVSVWYGVTLDMRMQGVET